MVALESLFTSLHTTDPSLLKYAIEKFNLNDVVSTEDVNRAAIQAWERVKLNLRRFQSDLFGYAKVIQSGADRLVERLDMLVGIAEKANKVPFKDEIRVKKNQKFSINGSFQPHDIRPLLEDTNNTFDFYDKVMLPYFGQIDKLLQTVEVNQTWTENSVMRFELFTAGKWMKNFKPLEQPDDRFRAASYVVRGVTAQGEKAIYYSGPPDTKTGNVKDWSYFMNTIRSLRYRYLKVDSNALLKDQNYAFVLDTVRFIATGRRRFSIHTWPALVTYEVPVFNESVQGRRDIYLLTEELHVPIQTEAFIQKWLSQKDGFNDMVYTLHLLFGSVPEKVNF